MIKPADRHLKSLDRALTILRLHLNRQKVPKYQRELIKDIIHLEQVKKLVAYHVNAPMFDHIINAVCELAV